MQHVRQVELAEVVQQERSQRRETLSPTAQKSRKVPPQSGKRSPARRTLATSTPF